jgi:hypothetical protein
MSETTKNNETSNNRRDRLAMIAGSMAVGLAIGGGLGAGGTALLMGGQTESGITSNQPSTDHKIVFGKSDLAVAPNPKPIEFGKSDLAVADTPAPTETTTVPNEVIFGQSDLAVAGTEPVAPAQPPMEQGPH